MRGASDDQSSYAGPEQPLLPTKPPYAAHLGYLTSDVTEADIEHYLSDCQVTRVRVVGDRVDQMPKGFAYVEFATLDGLESALARSEALFVRRRIRITVADPPEQRTQFGVSFPNWARKIHGLSFNRAVVSSRISFLTGRYRLPSQPAHRNIPWTTIA